LIRFDYEGAVTEARANLAEAQAALVENEGRVALEKANLVRAGEQLEFAQRDLERAEELLGRGAINGANG
jgi:multidrug efflux system membrane fusion protein